MVLKCWIESSDNILYDCTQILLMLYLSIKTFSINLI